MTQKEKQIILLQELCLRLPYGVKISKANVIYPMTGIDIALGYVELAISERLLIEEARPYLRPLSSMTPEEQKEYDLFILQEPDEPIRFTNSIKFYLRKHFDFEGLIPMGLAIEAPEGMYN